MPENIFNNLKMTSDFLLYLARIIQQSIIILSIPSTASVKVLVKDSKYGLFDFVAF